MNLNHINIGVGTLHNSLLYVLLPIICCFDNVRGLF